MATTGFPLILREILPATQKQCDLLFAHISTVYELKQSPYLVKNEKFLKMSNSKFNSKYFVFEIRNFESKQRAVTAVAA